MVNTIWFRFYLIRFRKYVSVYVWDMTFVWSPLKVSYIWSFETFYFNKMLPVNNFAYCVHQSNHFSWSKMIKLTYIDNIPFWHNRYNYWLQPRSAWSRMHPQWYFYTKVHNHIRLHSSQGYIFLLGKHICFDPIHASYYDFATFL